MIDYIKETQEMIEHLNDKNKRNRLRLTKMSKGDEIIKYTLWKNGTILTMKEKIREIYEIVEILYSYNY